MGKVYNLEAHRDIMRQEWGSEEALLNELHRRRDERAWAKHQRDVQRRREADRRDHNDNAKPYQW